MKRTLFTVCLITIAGITAYGQSTSETSMATTSVNVNVTLPNPPANNNNNSNNAMIGGNNNSNSSNVQVSSLSNEYMIFSSRANELNAVLARGSATNAQNIYDDLDQMMRNVMDQNQSEIEIENTPGLTVKLAQQKMLYTDIKKLSGNLIGNQETLKVKLDEFGSTL